MYLHICKYTDCLPIASGFWESDLREAVKKDCRPPCSGGGGRGTLHAYALCVCVRIQACARDSALRRGGGQKEILVTGPRQVICFSNILKDMRGIH